MDANGPAVLFWWSANNGVARSDSKGADYLPSEVLATYQLVGHGVAEELWHGHRCGW